MKNFNLHRLIRSNIQNLQHYSSARNEFSSFQKEYTFLDANESPFENGYNRYPDAEQHTLKKVIANLKGVTPSQVILGNGSNEIIDLLIRAFCIPYRDNIITLSPTYGMYRVLADINAIETQFVRLNQAFELQAEKVLQRIAATTKLIFICSPNNPTGNTFSAKAIEKIIQGFNGLVVLDEAYIDFSEEESWLYKLNKFPNLIVLQTFSKAYGMAGIRLGVAYATTKIIHVLHQLKPPYNINTATQKIALERLRNFDKVSKEIRLIIQQRNLFIEQLKKFSFVKRIYPTQANFVLIKVSDANKLYFQLLEEKIVVRNRTTLPLCKNTLRISIGNPQENKQLLKILKNIEL